MSDELSDPMGLLLAAARIDPVLMQAARQVEARILAADRVILMHSNALLRAVGDNEEIAREYLASEGMYE